MVPISVSYTTPPQRAQAGRRWLSRRVAVGGRGEGSRKSVLVFTRAPQTGRPQIFTSARWFCFATTFRLRYKSTAELMYPAVLPA
jgi:hypothetical protein